MRGFLSLKHNSPSDNFSHGSTALVGQGFVIVEVWRSHSDTPHSVGLLWTSDRPVAEDSTRQHIILTRDTAGFEPTGVVNALDHAANGIGSTVLIFIKPKCASRHCIKMHAL